MPRNYGRSTSSQNLKGENCESPYKGSRLSLYSNPEDREEVIFSFLIKSQKETKFLKIDFLLQFNKAMKLILTKALGTCEKFSAEINEENLIDSWEKVDLEISRV